MHFYFSICISFTLLLFLFSYCLHSALRSLQMLSIGASGLYSLVLSTSTQCPCCRSDPPSSSPSGSHSHQKPLRSPTEPFDTTLKSVSHHPPCGYHRPAHCSSDALLSRSLPHPTAAPPPPLLHQTPPLTHPPTPLRTCSSLIRVCVSAHSVHTGHPSRSHPALPSARRATYAEGDANNMSVAEDAPTQCPCGRRLPPHHAPLHPRSV